MKNREILDSYLKFRKKDLVKIIDPTDINFNKKGRVTLVDNDVRYLIMGRVKSYLYWVEVEGGENHPLPYTIYPNLKLRGRAYYDIDLEKI